MQLPLPIAELQLPAEAAILPPRGRRIYCNRSLRFDQVSMVGFDMDYTLAMYEQDAMDRLSIEWTARKLVERGYPEALLTMPYRTDFPIRGLLVDRKLGNVLKMDRYKYVKKAFHGMRELSREERRSLYHTKRLRPGTRRYHWVDTLYALSEVSVYAAVVDELERDGVRVDYDELFSHVRDCIDMAHRDGSILDAVLSNLPQYVVRDEELGETFHKLRSAGKRLFLLTNSHWAYTDRMMSYLLDHQMPEYATWRGYFDLIITASGKPGFFTENRPFQEVTADGTLRKASTFERGRVYAGGNIAELERRLGVPGDGILYVGDHIYGDVLRAKKESGWRTAMIIQDMSAELAILDRNAEAFDRIDALEELRDTLVHELRARQLGLKDVQRRIDDAVAAQQPPDPTHEAARVRHRKAIDRLRARLRAAELEIDQIEDEVDRQFHPFWGSMFKAGPEVSSFGDQVEVYACLYTDRVSNLLGYSPMHYFRSPRDRMPHEL
jgi:HAD superfamily 5'-nucleotidase-like hydrolase